MEDQACWGCGEFGHHRGACEKKIVQHHRDKYSHQVQKQRLSEIQMKRMREKKEIKVGPLPSMKLAKKEIGRIHQLLIDIDHEISELEESKKEVEDIDNIVVKVGQMRGLIAEELDTIRLLDAVTKGFHFRYPDEETAIMMGEMESVNLLRQSTYNTLYKINKRSDMAKTSLNTIEILRKELTVFAKSIRDFQSGRPLQLEHILDKKQKLKANLAASTEIVNKFKYVFNAKTRDEITKTVQKLQGEYKAASGVLKLINAETKLTCKICLENDREYALGCGHMFCGKCLEKLESCPNCRGDLNSIIRLYFD